MIINPYYESKIYIGSVRNDYRDVSLRHKVYWCSPSLPIEGCLIGEESLIETMGQQQEKYKVVIPLRLSLTTFVSGTNYKEQGWEIAAINYPRISATIEEIDEFMLLLGRRLLTDFHQHRITIVNPKEIIMLTEEEDRHGDE